MVRQSHHLPKGMAKSTERSRRIDVTATMACAGFLLCWSTGPIFVKLLTGYTDAWIQNWLRYCVASLFWLPFLLQSLSKGTVDPDKSGVAGSPDKSRTTNTISQTLSR